jgi:hypothetical protein
MFVESRVVFINFAVGSFGSFLWHTLAQSKTSYDISLLEDTFDEYGAAHNSLNVYLHHFHSREDISKWLLLDSDARKTAVKNSWKDPGYWDDSATMYLHRVTMPSRSSDIIKACPTAKLIIIDFDEDDVPLISSMLAKKILIPNHVSKEGVIPDETLIKRIATNMVMSNLPEKNVEGAYYFKFKYFLNESFIDEFNKLCEWLNFEVPDITEWYEEFKRVNNL